MVEGVDSTEVAPPSVEAASVVELVPHWVAEDSAAEDWEVAAFGPLLVASAAVDSQAVVSEGPASAEVTSAAAIWRGEDSAQATSVVELDWMRCETAAN